MATYEEAWTKGGDALSKKYGGDKSKFIKAAKAYNTKKYGTTEPTKDGKKNPTATANNERIQAVVNKTNKSANGGAGALPQKGAVMNKDKSGNVITNQSLPGGGSRTVIQKAGSKGAKKAENSTVRSSASNPDTKYGKYAKSMEGSGKETHDSQVIKAGKKRDDGKSAKSLKTGMGYSEESGRGGRKEKVYNKEGKKVAVVKQAKVKQTGTVKKESNARLTRAGRKDAETTLTKTNKRGVQKTKGAPEVKKEKRTASERKSDRITNRSDKSFDKVVKKQKRKGNWDYNTDTIKST